MLFRSVGRPVMEKEPEYASHKGTIVKSMAPGRKECLLYLPLYDCLDSLGHIDYLKAAGVPVWTFAGDIGDTERWYHKYLAQNVDQITVCGGFGKFTVLEGCDHGKARVEAYVEETFEWMLAQQNGVIPKE